MLFRSIGTDPLDSFEELAELLGQAKPQTVSKEDIDNSGLEVIRMSALPDYEKIGRVAPMCVDRVSPFRIDNVILTVTMQLGQRLIDGTRQLGLKLPLASAGPVGNVNNASHERQKMTIDVRDIREFPRFLDAPLSELFHSGRVWTSLA